MLVARDDKNKDIRNIKRLVARDDNEWLAIRVALTGSKEKEAVLICA